jgi:hypothetical protein
MRFELIVNGLSFGTYEFDTPEQAIHAMYVDAGYEGSDDDRLCDIDYATDGNRIMIHTVRVA